MTPAMSLNTNFPFCLHLLRTCFLPLIGLIGAVACFGGQIQAAPFPWLSQIGQPLEKLPAIESLLEKMEGKQVVLLGEATHGTHEFYTWRALISCRLVESGHFRFIAVEGDWASLWQVNRYIKNKPGAADSARQAMAGIQRWPEWMWANEETLFLVEWLREWNDQRPMEERVGFYGMDVYAPWEAAAKILIFSRNHLGEAETSRVERKLARFLRHENDVQGYVSTYYSRRAETLVHLRSLVRFLLTAQGGSEAEHFAALQSAYVVKGAHQHFMGMVHQNADSWNARVQHMTATVDRLMQRYGPDAGGIVWAHNTHIGDARATSMAESGQLNMGQLAREQRGMDQVFSLGFSTHRGTVQAGRKWGGTREEMTIPPAVSGSLEEALNKRFANGALLLLGGDAPDEAHQTVVPHRAIGVIYHPEKEAGNYVPSRLASRYDAMIFLPETQALQAF